MPYATRSKVKHGQAKLEAFEPNPEQIGRQPGRSRAPRNAATQVDSNSRESAHNTGEGRRGHGRRRGRGRARGRRAVGRVDDAATSPASNQEERQASAAPGDSPELVQLGEPHNDVLRSPSEHEEVVPRDTVQDHQEEQQGLGLSSEYDLDPSTLPAPGSFSAFLQQAMQGGPASHTIEQSQLSRPTAIQPASVPAPDPFNINPFSRTGSIQESFSSRMPSSSTAEPRRTALTPLERVRLAQRQERASNQQERAFNQQDDNRSLFEEEGDDNIDNNIDNDIDNDIDNNIDNNIDGTLQEVDETIHERREESEIYSASDEDSSDDHESSIHEGVGERGRDEL